LSWTLQYRGFPIRNQPTCANLFILFRSIFGNSRIVREKKSMAPKHNKVNNNTEKVKQECYGSGYIYVLVVGVKLLLSLQEYIYIFFPFDASHVHM
jgi:hypothetical protein